MSDKFFFKGRPGNKPKDFSFGFSTKREIKPGTAEHPLALTVATQERKIEIEDLVEKHALFANITINEETAENLAELDCILNKPETVAIKKTPNRNDPCSCGSGKKYKKCCA